MDHQIEMIRTIDELDAVKCEFHNCMGYVNSSYNFKEVRKNLEKANELVIKMATAIIINPGWRERILDCPGDMETFLVLGVA